MTSKPSSTTTPLASHAPTDAGTAPAWCRTAASTLRSATTTRSSTGAAPTCSTRNPAGGRGTASSAGASSAARPPRAGRFCSSTSTACSSPTSATRSPQDTAGGRTSGRRPPRGRTGSWSIRCTASGSPGWPPKPARNRSGPARGRRTPTRLFPRRSACRRCRSFPASGISSTPGSAKFPLSSAGQPAGRSRGSMTSLPSPRSSPARQAASSSRWTRRRGCVRHISRQPGTGC